MFIPRAEPPAPRFVSDRERTPVDDFTPRRRSRWRPPSLRGRLARGPRPGGTLAPR